MEYAAAKSFGKFQESFLSELYAEIVSHTKQTGAAEPMKGITVHDSDMLEPEPVRSGGLMRKDGAVRTHPSIPLDKVVKLTGCDSATHLKRLRGHWSRLRRGRLFLAWIDLLGKNARRRRRRGAGNELGRTTGRLYSKVRLSSHLYS